MTMTLFRNVEGSTADPVETWPYEGMVSVIEHGLLPDWRPLIAHIRQHPWGNVARALEAYLGYAEDARLVAFFRLMLDRARSRAESEERFEVARRIRGHLEASGLTRAEFARAIGTSPSRLSTYLSGKVVPSAGLMVRMERVVQAVEKS